MQSIDSLGRNEAYFRLTALFRLRRVPIPDKKSDQPATMPGREIRSQPQTQVRAFCLINVYEQIFQGLPPRVSCNGCIAAREKSMTPKASSRARI